MMSKGDARGGILPCCKSWTTVIQRTVADIKARGDAQWTVEHVDKSISRGNARWTVGDG